MTNQHCIRCTGSGKVTNPHNNLIMACPDCSGRGNRSVSGISGISGGPALALIAITLGVLDFISKHITPILEIGAAIGIFVLLLKNKHTKKIAIKVLDFILFLIKVVLILLLIIPIYKGLSFLVNYIFKKLNIEFDHAPLAFILMIAAYSSFYFYQDEPIENAKVFLYKSISVCSSYLNNPEYFLKAKFYFKTHVNCTSYNCMKGVGLSDVNAADKDNNDGRESLKELLVFFPNDKEVLKALNEYKKYDKEVLLPKIRKIPPQRFEDKLEGYKTLSILDPNNTIYIKKLYLYSDKIQ